MQQEEKETLAVILENLYEEIKEIEERQKCILKEIETKNKIVMQRINKIQEHNEIQDMRAQLIERQLKNMQNSIIEIKNKLY